MRSILLFLIITPIALVGGCAHRDKFVMATPSITLDLDSLHRANLHQDSVDENIFFYDQAFEGYRERFPGVDRPAFMRIARGKDRDFCLFRADPAATCLDIGDKLEALGLDEQAEDAYEAGLVSEGMNGGRMNIRFWSGLGRIHVGRGEISKAEPFLSKVLEVEPKNREAKRLLASAARQKTKG